jgi:hypothetical protein
MARRVFPFVVLAVCLPGLAAAQGSPKLGLLIPSLYGPNGLIVDSLATLPDGSDHSAHFNASFQSEFGQFNIALATQLITVPFPSPASGYTYEFDETIGAYSRSTQSFGPILTDRAETIGKGRFTFGFTYQNFNFDSIEGVALDSIPAVFTHDGAELGGGRSDVVITQNRIRTEVSRFIGFFSYGLTDRFDVSVAVPIVDTSLSAVSDALIDRIGTSSNPLVHFYEGTQGQVGDQREYRVSGSKSGLGDVLLRLKGTAVKSRSTAMGLIFDVRFPTGDEENLLGSGAWGVKPTFVLSWSLGRVSPHLNLGYQWNGESVLAGDIQSMTKADLPDQFLYAAGLDVGLGSHVTVVFDVLGQRVSDSPRFVQTTFTAADGSMLPQVGFENGSFSLHDAAVGLKLNLAGQLLLDANVLIKLDNAGLRDDISPLVAFEYGF